MKIKWTSKAVSDLNRLYEFLSRVNPDAAQQTLRSLSRGPDHLITNPRLGEQLYELPVAKAIGFPRPRATPKSIVVRKH
ncbi:type II toxin-antitoxin system RelE/ParE family toxin [Nitrincola schmidtii]|uniref:type II toxin-antitoxin system RelE/ParE family toxin n=1 Tax=Nitrincola schmidtii TaxID=1730894 RepID=UPI00124F3495